MNLHWISYRDSSVCIITMLLVGTSKE